MPMIDIYATVGTFADAHKLAAEAAAVVKGVENVPDIPMFRENTAAFVHEMAAGAIANVDGDGGYVRVQVLTNAGALDREKQIAVVSQLTDLVAVAANDPDLRKRTWVLLTEATPGGWGLWGHAHTNDELVGAARAEIAKLRGGGWRRPWLLRHGEPHDRNIAPTKQGACSRSLRHAVQQTRLRRRRALLVGPIHPAQRPYSAGPRWPVQSRSRLA